MQSCRACRAQVVVKGAAVRGSVGIHQDCVTNGGESCGANVGHGNAAHSDGSTASGLLEDATRTDALLRSSLVVRKAFRSPRGDDGSTNYASLSSTCTPTGAQHHGSDGSPLKFVSHLATDVDGSSCSCSGNSPQFASPRSVHTGRRNSDASCASGNDVSSRAGGSGSCPGIGKGHSGLEGRVRRFSIAESDPSALHGSKGTRTLSPSTPEGSPFSAWCSSRRSSDTWVVQPPPGKRPQRRRPALPLDLPSLVGRKGMAGDAHPSDLELSTTEARDRSRSYSELVAGLNIADLDAGWDRAVTT